MPDINFYQGNDQYGNPILIAKRYVNGIGYGRGHKLRGDENENEINAAKDSLLESLSDEKLQKIFPDRFKDAR